MTAEEFTSGMLRELRREFFKGATEQQFFEERAMLLEAITYPARYLNQRGAQAVASKYQQILRTVIRAIKTKGNHAVVRRFSLYFFKCVQEHMAHHGDEYYEESKTRPLGALLKPAIRKMRQVEAVETTDALASAHRVLALRSGRKRAIQKSAKAETETDLFRLSKPIAVAVQMRCKTSSDVCKTGPIHGAAAQKLLRRPNRDSRDS